MQNAEESHRPAPRSFVIDGLNLAYWCGQPPQLRLPLTLMAHLLACGHAVLVYFDASTPHRLQARDLAVYEQMRAHPQHFIEVSSGRRADGEMLRRARSTAACIVSRDRFRDYRRRFRKLIDDPTRVISGLVRDEVLQLPSLALAAALPSSVDELWEQFCERRPAAPMLTHPCNAAVVDAQ